MRYSAARVTALGSSLPGRREPFPGLENPCLQPPGDHLPRGETAGHFQQVPVADLAGGACQISIKNPHPLRFPVQGVKQGFYRVVAAAARPEPNAMDFSMISVRDVVPG